ncbi:MAG: hypothetical protein HPY66_3018 [Firmicutes bacterium]|nr:hypothetical protein [Bacillota bacterium]
MADEGACSSCRPYIFGMNGTLSRYLDVPLQYIFYNSIIKGNPKLV